MVLLRDPAVFPPTYVPTLSFLHWPTFKSTCPSLSFAMVAAYDNETSGLAGHNICDFWLRLGPTSCPIHIKTNPNVFGQLARLVPNIFQYVSNCMEISVNQVLMPQTVLATTSLDTL